MDIYCKTCGEPWDMDTLHDVVSERMLQGLLPTVTHPGVLHGEEYKEYRSAYEDNYHAVRKDFYRNGCRAMTGYRSDWCGKPSSEGMAYTAQVADSMYDLFGDDLDAVACMMEDAGF